MYHQLNKSFKGKHVKAKSIWFHMSRKFLPLFNTSFTHELFVKLKPLLLLMHDIHFFCAGKLEAGADADIVILSPEGLEVQNVIARGKLLKTPSATCGRFEMTIDLATNKVF